jgi:putative SOS response-associated peptidase YedK
MVGFSRGTPNRKGQCIADRLNGMCGRYALAASSPDLAKWFHIDETINFAPRVNIAPTDMVPAIRQRADGRRELIGLRWGLIPYWSHDAKSGARAINARAESVAEKPAFRDPFRKRRCLIPASGFYEWKTVGRAKQPYFVHPRDGGLLAFAGLWDRWESPEGDPIESCTILTQDANELVRPLHDRMPVVVAPTDYDRWLDRHMEDLGVLKPLLAGASDDLLAVTAADPAINSVKYQPDKKEKTLFDL